MSEPGMEIALPATGELIPRDDPERIARAIHDLRALDADIRDALRALTDALIEYAGIEGVTGILRLGPYQAEIRPNNRTVWDSELLEDGLRAAGMPEARIREIVVETVTHTVNAVEARRAARANPAYGAVVERASRTLQGAPSATVKEAR